MITLLACILLLLALGGAYPVENDKIPHLGHHQPRRRPRDPHFDPPPPQHTPRRRSRVRRDSEREVETDTLYCKNSVKLLHVKPCLASLRSGLRRRLLLLVGNIPLHPWKTGLRRRHLPQITPTAPSTKARLDPQQVGERSTFQKKIKLVEGKLRGNDVTQGPSTTALRGQRRRGGGRASRSRGPGSSTLAPQAPKGLPRTRYKGGSDDELAKNIQSQHTWAWGRRPGGG